MRSTRIDRLVAGLRALEAEALICSLPSQVLLLTGYWPIVGTAIAILTVGGEITLIAPTDEREHAENAQVDRLILTPFGTLDEPTSLEDDIRPILKAALYDSGFRDGAPIAFDFGPNSEQSPYVAFTIYGDSLGRTVRELLPTSSFLDTHEVLRDTAAILTTREIDILRRAAQVVRDAYVEGTSAIRDGTTEIAASLPIQNLLTLSALTPDASDRAFGHVACMSGKNSGTAFGAYARSTRKTIARGDLVLTHCNSTISGYWTDVSRTYFVGEPSARVCAMYEAMLKASRAGIASVKPGVAAADVDKAVRDSLLNDGFGEQFKHGTGHGVGFAAIDHRAKPRLRPNSPDVIEPGMVFNIEPGIYFEEFGGMRHCDMVLCTESGAELLTPFHSTIEEFLL